MTSSGFLAGLLASAAPGTLVAQVPADQVAMPLAPRIIFWVLCALTLSGAVTTITRRNLVSAAMALVATFFGLASLYAMIAAHFLAAIQVLVYAGGIMTLFVFVVMVLNREEAEPWALRGPLTKALGVGALAYLAARLCQLLWAVSPLAGRAGLLHFNAAQPPAEFGTVAGVGQVLFTDFLFPFEAISILLVIAVIAAVVLARTSVARASSMYDLPAGEVDIRQPQHAIQDEVVGLPAHLRRARRPTSQGGH